MPYRPESLLSSSDSVISEAPVESGRVKRNDYSAISTESFFLDSEDILEACEGVEVLQKDSFSLM